MNVNKMCSYTCRARFISRISNVLLNLNHKQLKMCGVFTLLLWCIEQLCTQIYICLCNWWKQLKIKPSIYYIAYSCFTVRCYVSVYRFRLLRSKENASSVPFDSLKATSSLTALTCLVYVDLVLGFSVFFLYCAVFFMSNDCLQLVW